MFTSMLSAAVLGVECHLIRVETDVSDGLPVFNMVGCLSMQAREAQDRVRTAMRNAGYVIPAKRITINLAPGDVRKEGTGFDLPVALTILASLGRIPPVRLEKMLAVGELSLDGKIGPLTGILAIVMEAKAAGCPVCMVPMANLLEASMVQGIQVIGVNTLHDAVRFVTKGGSGDAPKVEKKAVPEEYICDFRDIKGQESAKRAAVIAAAGFHHLLLVGPPGVGKSMIARRMGGILPPLTLEESLEITKIYSIMGLLPPEHGLMCQRPFRSPHHTVSPQALTGGGKIPRPGEITLSHKGILFLDELTEFHAGTLEVLRQPLETQKIIISRVSGSYVFPAHCMLVCAMNPCGCGFFPDMSRCNCRPEDVSRYLRKVSKPLLDRIDICVEVPQISYQETQSREFEYTTASMRSMVERARVCQEQRFCGTRLMFNSQIPPHMLKEYCAMTKDAGTLLEKAYTKMGFSVRGYHRILRTARTIADLEQAEKIQTAHIAEAISYRTIDEKYWK